MYHTNLFINDGIIYYTTDECRKQYRCANAISLLSVFWFTHRVIIDRFSNDPGHIIIKIYGINGS